MGLVDMAVVVEEMGRALVPGPFLSSAVLAPAILERAEAGRALLSNIADGKVKAAVAVGGRDGRARFVAHAAIADFILFASSDEISLVERGAPGVEIAQTPSIDVTRPLYDVNVANAKGGSVLLREQAAREALEHAMDATTAALTAEMTGGMDRLLEMTVAYAKTRKQFDRPIGQFQAVQHLCAD